MDNLFLSALSAFKQLLEIYQTIAKFLNAKFSHQLLLQPKIFFIINILSWCFEQYYLFQMFSMFSYLLTSLFRLNLLSSLTFLAFKYTFGQQQYGYSTNNNNPFYSLGNPSTSQFSPYGKSSYFYLTPYGNYGKSGYEVK